MEGLPSEHSTEYLIYNVMARSFHKGLGFRNQFELKLVCFVLGTVYDIMNWEWELLQYLAERNSALTYKINTEKYT